MLYSKYSHLESYPPIIKTHRKVYYWGRLSDVHGRRMILLLGPLGLTLAMLGFGLSKAFVTLVIFRALQGIFNGNIGTLLS